MARLEADSGSILVRASRQILVFDADAQVVDGSLTFEANQQAEWVTGEGAAVRVLSGKVRCEGKGGITLTGRGGGLGLFPVGVQIKDGALVQGGTSEPLRISGRGSNGVNNDDVGVGITGTAPHITSKGADILIVGIGGDTGFKSGYNRGVAMDSGHIKAGGKGRIVITGTGGQASGPRNQGIFLLSENVTIASTGGDVTLTGTGGGTSNSEGGNEGVMLWEKVKVSAQGAGKLTIVGNGNRNAVGITMGDSCALSAETGGIHITAKSGALETTDIRVKMKSTITTKDGGKITIDAERQKIDEGSLSEAR